LLEATDAALISRATSGALLVARRNATRSKDLAAVESLRAVDARALAVVLNRRLRRGRLGTSPTQLARSGARPAFYEREVAAPLEGPSEA
jgi:Mrp family chromosome partitioning ATPase